MRFEELSVPAIEALDRESTVIVLPIGAVEQHGQHMPVGTDTMLAQAIALEAAGRLEGRVAVMPPPWYGFSAHHMHFAGTVALQPATMIALLEDIVASIIAHGFRRILVVNGHGGNGGVIDIAAAKLGHQFHGKARIACRTYFQLARDAIAKLRESKPGGMGHASAFETSMMLHVRPGLVDVERAV